MTESRPPEGLGVPLGGVGAGCIEFGTDARFRNITINNNRTLQTRIPVSEGAFLAVRAAHAGETRPGEAQTRILHPATGLPFTEAGIAPPYTAAEQLSWNPLYPLAEYRLDAAGFPVQVRWTVLAPIIPYDTTASMLPALLFFFDLSNLAQESVDVSVLVNWENLSGCTQGHFPEDRGRIRPVFVNDAGDLSSRPASANPAADAPSENEDRRPPRPHGLWFGGPPPYRTNAEGQYCLVAREEAGASIDVAAWNERDSEALKDFWNSFERLGAVSGGGANQPENHSGAVCCRSRLAPQANRRFVFALAWFCPRFVVGKTDQGNGYTNLCRDVLAVATNAIKHHNYYLNAVRSWQDRFLSSSLPRWLSLMLINNNHVFSTNTLWTKAGAFGTIETPAAPLTGSLDRRFHSSLGLLLFFPRLEQEELGAFAKAEPPGEPGRLYRHLGTLCLDQPSHGVLTEELMDLGPKFVLMAYRDYCMTGKTVVVERLYPRIKAAMHYLLDKDLDSDGLPEAEDFTTTFDTWRFHGVNSYAGSLWIAALCAYVKLARTFGDRDEANTFAAIVPKAVESFQRRLWYADGGYYFSHDNPGDKQGPREATTRLCHSGQLAGQWYADFLCLGCLFPEDQIEKALRAIYRRHERNRATTPWSAFHLTSYGCLEIAHGDADRALKFAQRVYDTIHVAAGRAFDQPWNWNPQTNQPWGCGDHRHMSATSIWHLLYAIEGFHLNVAEKSLWLRPRLPRGVFAVSLPLFSPVCFGSLKFQETDEGKYRQKVQVSFDSPVEVQSIVLRVPEEVRQAAVTCEGGEGAKATEHAFGYDGKRRLVKVVFRSPVTIREPLTLSLMQTEGGQVVLPR